MKLSIIIPAYNVEKCILHTLASLVTQKKENFELLIVDDGSTDNTYNIIKETLERNGFCSYKIICQSNRGVSSARNVGLTEATGKYVLFLDGDDYVSNDFVEEIYRYVASNEVDILCWGFDMVTEEQIKVMNYYDKYVPQLKTLTGKEVLNEILIERKLWIWTGSAAYRRDFLYNNELYYSEGCANGEDQEFTFKALSKAGSVGFINTVLSFYVQRKGSITNRYDISKFDTIEALERAYDYINNNCTDNMEEIINKILNQEIISNYFCNLQACFNNLKKKDIRMILHDVDEHYPKLNNEMRIMMKAYKGKDKKLFLKSKIFLISPFLCFWLIHIKSIAKTLKRKGKV